MNGSGREDEALRAGEGGRDALERGDGGLLGVMLALVGDVVDDGVELLAAKGDDAVLGLPGEGVAGPQDVVDEVGAAAFSRGTQNGGRSGRSGGAGRPRTPAGACADFSNWCCSSLIMLIRGLDDGVKHTGVPFTT